MHSNTTIYSDDFLIPTRRRGANFAKYILIKVNRSHCYFSTTAELTKVEFNYLDADFNILENEWVFRFSRVKIEIEPSIELWVRNITFFFSLFDANLCHVQEVCSVKQTLKLIAQHIKQFEMYT